jgi:two-component system chemotaxis response regulator CheB
MTITAASRPILRSATAQRAIRVMVVDDAVVVRGLIARWVESEPGLEVVAALRSGREAIAQIAHVDPDVVILDVDMPDMDGITALPQLAGAGARRCRLHPEAGDHARGHHVGDLPPRAR